ncbi:MAG: sugar ABC transporter permease [Pseudomonadota bacterium]
MIFRHYQKKHLWPLAFLLPTIIGLLVFRLIPIFWSFALSFMDWQIFDTATFAGLDNYIYIFQSVTTLQILRVTFLFMLMYVPGAVLLALALAVILNSGLRGAAFFRGAFFLPYITSTVAVVLVWRWIFSTRFGLLNNALDYIGIEQNPAWLADPAYALPAVAIVSIWKDAGFYMLLLLAGLQTINNEYYEAARVDGATRWRRFIDITVPLLSRSLFFVLIIAMIRSTQTFEITYSLTEGGPNGATTTLAFAIYQRAFVDFDMGLAAALSYVLCVILGFLTLVQFWLRRRWVHE